LRKKLNCLTIYYTKTKAFYFGIIIKQFKKFADWYIANMTIGILYNTVLYDICLKT